MEDETPLDSKYDYEVRRQTEFYGISTEDWLALTIKVSCWNKLWIVGTSFGSLAQALGHRHMPC